MFLFFSKILSRLTRCLIFMSLSLRSYVQRSNYKIDFPTERMPIILEIEEVIKKKKKNSA